ncbi:uncharacterized protein Z520_04152 [Fonsecaea multimorphosa CBS 102226]|uniref:Uncharacterized protein n=1 Tax=Fonsecaea multimorphosa CBS 102226 TaxID=1442371 RepID=A0A0D2IU16_9EURO|nr:uncharacterized protein Z520_04152 [Fonsecaea multimorphosa CBS 102226]KIY00467.1 hypothetical protein Z520_04152 [Fonsecaea multimorphosa CBS 102226]OAL26981.1 hypothetical protein AYO22_03925 [Fonsecaea multimorphosa]
MGCILSKKLRKEMEEEDARRPAPSSPFFPPAPEPRPFQFIPLGKGDNLRTPPKRLTASERYREYRKKNAHLDKPGDASATMVIEKRRAWNRRALWGIVHKGCENGEKSRLGSGDSLECYCCMDKRVSPPRTPRYDAKEVLEEIARLEAEAEAARLAAAPADNPADAPADA